MDEEPRKTEVEQALAVLDRARAEHAAAMLAVKDRPGDPQARQQFREAVVKGRCAWQSYQQAATAGLADQIKAIIPGAFREQQDEQGQV